MANNKILTLMPMLWIVLILSWSFGTRKIPDLLISQCSTNGKCQCCTNSKGEIVADCVGKKISDIPVFGENVSIVHLKNNNIGSLPPGRFPPGVTYLDLSRNQLKRFYNNSFDDFHNLIHLDLSDNDIDYKEGCFNVGLGLFGQLKSLKTLMIQLNHNLDNHISHYPDVITDVPTLESLYMDGIAGAKFSLNFTKLTNLQSLVLTGMLGCGRCNINSLDTSLFRNTPHLVFLNMSRCDLQHFEPGSLTTMPKLQELNISNNELFTFKFMSAIFKDLASIDLKVLDMSKLHCTYGVGISLYKSDILNFNETRITHLYFDSNRINFVESEVVYHFPSSLVLFSVKDNLFTMGIYFLQFSGVKGLKEVIADNMYDSHDPTDVSHPFRICYDWRGPPEHFTDEYNQEMTLLTDMMQFVGNANVNVQPSKMRCYSTGLEPIFSFPPKLEIFRCSNSALKYTIPCIHVNPNNSLKHADFSRNVFNRWEGPIYYLNHLRHLDLSENFCDYVEPTFFKEFATLKTLLIHKNMLGFELNDIRYNILFENLTELLHLNMSSNSIRSLPKYIFNNQPHLEILNLSTNMLSDWDIEMSNLGNLKLLDLSQNQIQLLGLSSRIHIQNNNDLKINLFDNLFQCSCDTLEFLKWMELYKEKFKYFPKYKCQLEDTSYYFSDIKFIIKKLEYNCNSRVTVIFSGVAASVLCLLGMVTVLVYHFRWRLRYKYYMMKNRLVDFIQTVDRPGYEFDAFVSYAENDNNIVDRIIDVLENQRGFHLCIHKRDFQPGKKIAENVTGAINRSRKMIIILSQSYMNSSWCMFEYNIAREEYLDKRQDTNYMFVVLCEDIPERNLPLDLFGMIKTKSYLRFPDTRDNSEEFWNQIAKTIE